MLKKKIALLLTITDTVIAIKKPGKRSGSAGKSSDQEEPRYRKTRRKCL